MKKIFFLLFLTPLISQELMINSFNNDLDYDENYWVLDQSGDSEIGYINFSESAISHDNVGAIKFDYSIHASEVWGGFTKISHFHPDQNSVYDLSDYNTISFWYYNEIPASVQNITEIRFVLYDVSTSSDNNIYDDSQVEYFYSFHFDMLDQSPGWNKIEIPLVGTNIQDQNQGVVGFNNTGWNGISGDSNFDLDSIKGFAFEFFAGSSSDNLEEYVTGTFILDELKAENTIIAEPEEILITFQVDMSNENINPACPPTLAGGWNGWSYTYGLEENQNNIWSIEIPLSTGVEYEYKFGNCGWELESLEPNTSCTNTSGIYTNRVLNSYDSDTILEPVCFGSCESDCPVAGLVDVTFTLDVNNNDVNFNPLCDNYLIGSFQQPFPWDIDIFPIPLANMGNGIYETTVSLLSGTNIEYKFANCLSTDSFIENDIDICSNNEGERFLTVPFEDTILPSTYFNSCNSEGTVIVTFQVDMTNESVGGGDGECGVHIGGDFNFFDWWSDELTSQDNDNIWKTSIVLNSGDQIQYKFANCGSFGIESVPPECSGGQDQNRFIVVPNQDIIIDPVCFGGCDSECGELDYSQVTFSVDMREVETSSTGVYVSGQNLQGPSGLALTDDNQDDIWTLTTPLPYGEYTYKFRNGYYDDWDSEGWEDVSLISDCSYGEFNDRIVVVDTPVVDAGSFCFESCQTCLSSALLGDVNEDNNVDVLDIVLIVNSIISTTSQPNNADVNSDGSVDVLDIVMIVGWIVD